MQKFLGEVFKQYKFWIYWSVIIVLALVLRVYQLNAVPNGLTIDEAAIGYNGFAIARQHRDEWLEFMPLSFKSFGEYKPPVAIYAVAVLSLFFETTTFIIRLPMAIAGVVTVVASYALARKLLNDSTAALFVMLLVAVSPLNIHFSRIAFESSIGVALATVGAVFFVWADEYQKRKQFLFYFLAGLSWAVALYSNHTTKMMVPFIILGLLWYKRRLLKKNYLQMSTVVILTCLAAIPIIIQMISAEATSAAETSNRLVMTSALIDEDGLKPISSIVEIIITNLLAHFDPRFLIFGLTDDLRHGNGVYGILSFLEAVLVVTGTLYIVIKKELRKKYLWILLVCVIALLPAVISTPVPHANRIHHIMVWIQILAGVGLVQLLSHFNEKKKTLVVGGMALVIFLQLAWQLPNYYRVYTTVAAEDFQYGFAEVVGYASMYEAEVNEIYFTDAYDQVYIYLLLYKKVLPLSYHHGALIKYKILPTKWAEHANSKNILVIAAPDEVPESITPTHTVYFPDGTIAFKVIKL